MSPEQLEAMRAGKERKRRERQKHATARVVTFKRWCANGCRGPAPEIPRSSDYRIAGYR